VYGCFALRGQVMAAEGGKKEKVKKNTIQPGKAMNG
jgi:hypothetical protein